MTRKPHATVRIMVSGLAGALVSGVVLAADGDSVPFKLGTFEANGKAFLGLVLQDKRVVDIAAANVVLERRDSKAAKVQVPADMKELIARYEADVGPRLRAIAAANASVEPGSAGHVHAISALKVLPPVRPSVILNAGANYPEHAQGIVEQNARAASAANAPPAGAPPAAAAGAGAPSGAAPGGGRPAGAPPARAPAGSAPGIWERAADDKRPDNPYLFLKSPTVVVGAYDDVVIPRGREQIDWECEFALIVGKPAKNVSVGDAPAHVFGYSIQMDVSDRGGRNDRKMGGGPDWLLQKNHDTFGPIGPFIVPKEFLPNPMNTRHYFTLNGEIKQDSNTSRMEYNIWEMLSYASNILTLSPGDMIATGSPAGTNIERSNPRWMKAGDVGACVIEGIGEQRHNIVAQK